MYYKFEDRPGPPKLGNSARGGGRPYGGTCGAHRWPGICVRVRGTVSHAGGNDRTQPLGKI